MPKDGTALLARGHRLPTAFELRLHKVCKSIPAGKVSTYGTLAKVLHSAPRAVGQALKRNPYAPTVPCHRVIASSLQLGGFSGVWDSRHAFLKKKQHMLRDEGVEFTEDGKLADPESCLMDMQQLKAAAAPVGSC